MKVYLAGMFSTIKTRKAQAAELRAMGIGVTSRWIDETVPHNVEMKDIQDQYHIETAIADIEDIEAADVFVTFVPTDAELVDATLRSASRGGRHVEFGYALKAGKPILVVGGKENVFHHYRGKTPITHVHTWVEAKAVLMEIADAELCSPYKKAAMDGLILDAETFCLESLKLIGIDNYAKHPSTGISCLAYRNIGETKIKVWLPHAGPPPVDLMGDLADASVPKIAWNSSFEYNIVRYVLIPKYLKEDWHVPLEQWRDPIIPAHNLSLPGKLKDVANILKMKERKDERGDELVKMFCQPTNLKQLEKFKADPVSNMTLFGPPVPLFRTHATHPKEFAEYVEYCMQDVRAEADLWERLQKIPFPEIEWKGWLLDQKINEFGMPGNRKMAENMYRIALRFHTERNNELKALTGLKKPATSDKQMKGWLEPRGYTLHSLEKKHVAAALLDPEMHLTKDAREALELRKAARKTSYTKVAKFLAMLSSDDRLRWQFKYMAAARTGRWAAGKTDDSESSVMVQNMSRGEKAVKKMLKRAIELVMAEDYDGIVKEFPSVTPVDVVISLLRSLFQATPGKKIIVADKNAIENRMLGWAAGCKAILDVFRTCNDCGFIEEELSPSPFECSQCGCRKARCPYLAFGTKLYNKEYKDMWATYVGGNEEERQNSKPPVLGAGYGLGGGELYVNEHGDTVRGGLWGYAKTVCGVDMPKELAHKGVKIFRTMYPEVVQFWTDLEEAFKQVLKRGGVIKVGEVTWDKKNKEWIPHPTTLGCVLTFTRIKMAEGGYIVRMELPSGRALHYLNATIEKETRQSQRTGDDYQTETIYYDGIEHSATTDATGAREKKRTVWGRTKSYGGKICENAIQAMSRDDLVNSMLEADDLGFHMWGLFHDEIACEEDDVPLGGLSLHDLVSCMSMVPKWAPGLLLGAEGYEAAIYKKG